MIKQLRADFFRLIKNRTLMLLLIVSAVVLSVWVTYFAIIETMTITTLTITVPRLRRAQTVYLVAMIRIFSVLLPFISAIFCTMFIGTELSWNTWRNKVITGTKKSSIYFSNLTVTVIVSVIYQTLYAVLSYVTLYLFSKKNNMEITKDVWTSYIAVLMWTIAFSCLYVTINMYFSARIFSLAITLLMAISISYATSALQNALNQPYKYVSVDEETKETITTLNPAYIGGTKRKIITYLVEGSPFSLWADMEEDDNNFSVSPAKMKTIAAVTGSISMISIAAGAVSFDRKEFS